VLTTTSVAKEMSMSNSQTVSPAGSVCEPTAAQPRSKSKSKRRGREAQPTARAGSKKAAVIAMLKRPKGATLKDVMKATGWQAHSVRGFLSGSLRKSLGLKVKSSKSTDGQRVYQLKA
jgi:hypothetical protein